MNWELAFMKVGKLFLILIFILISGCAKEVTELNISPVESMADFCKQYPRADYASLNRIDSIDKWFELYEVAPGITAIYEPHQWQEVISYLIEGDESALLFDSGNGIADIAQVIETLTDKPVAVLNSHSHYDHVGGNYRFKKIYAMDTEFTRKRQKGILNKDIAIEVSPQALCRDLPNGVKEDNHTGQAYQITDFIQDGHKIDLGNRVLEVLHVPGHTPDAIVLIDRDAGLMWTGDSYYSGPIWLFAPETDLEAYIRSLDRLVKEVPNLKALLPAHNTPWVQPKVLLSVQSGFKKLINGETQIENQGDGMFEHKILDETRFTFLMRDLETYD